MKPYLMRSSVRSSAHNRAGGNWLKGGECNPHLPPARPYGSKAQPQNFWSNWLQNLFHQNTLYYSPMFSDLPQPLHKVLGHCVTIRACLFVLSDSIIRKTQTLSSFSCEVSIFVNIYFKIAKSFKASS